MPLKPDTSRRRGIAVLLQDLRPGGTERMRVQMAAEWMRLGFAVDFVLLRKTGELLSMLPDAVNVIDLGAPRFRNAMAPLICYLRAHRPAVVVAAMWPLTVIAILATKCARSGSRLVVSDHSVLSRSYAEYGCLHRLVLRTSLALCYRGADARICVSKGVARDLSRLSGIDVSRFSVIHNPAAVGRVNHSSPMPEELAGVRGPVILSVGTLKVVKNHALLIEAFSRLDASLAATLCILGEGALRADLEEMVRAKGLQERVLLPGFRANTAPYYRHADLFVLSSDHEGFGNVLVEAMEQGVPVVSTDCPYGPREILVDGKFGRLVTVDDADALATAIAESLRASHDREALKQRAGDFSVDKISEEYLEVMLPGWRGRAAA